jgi:hypothetical protein
MTGIFLIASCYDVEKLEPTVNKDIKVESRDGSSIFQSGCGPGIEIQCASGQSPNNQQFTLTNVVGYPGCIFYVNVEYIDCLNPPNQLRLFVGKITLLDWVCPLFESQLTTAISQGGVAVNNLLNALDKKLIEAAEIELFNFFKPTGPTCDQVFVTVNWYLSTCIQRCIGSGIKPGGGIKYTIATRTCGSGCCLRQTDICRNNSGIIVVNATTTLLGGNTSCSGPSNAPPFPPGKLCDIITPCTFNCQ